MLKSVLIYNSVNTLNKDDLMQTCNCLGNMGPHSHG